MPESDTVLARLKAARELPELLDAASDAFSLLLASCRDCETQTAEMFAAFAYAAAAAEEGRSAIRSAASLPAGPATQTSYAPGVKADLEKAADDLGDLAQVLGHRLSSAARQARDPGDQVACTNAAAQAARIHQLLARNP
jgi:hypothetical protein